MTTSTVAKNTQKLQRAIVDGLEDVKAQDIVVFDTEHLSSLFERVIIASGTSNRQTKALAASVRDAVREAGFPKPRIEGEANGEWIIVDCAQAVVHIFQPNFRQYYHLEELWGEKPVRLKLGAAKPAVAEAAKPAAKAPAKKAVGEPSMRRSSAAKKGVEEAFPSKAALKKAAAKSAGVKTPAKKAPAKKAATPKAPVKTVVVKPEVKKTAAKAVAAKKAPAKKAAPRKA
ncbi:ribosome silencing factor [Rhodoferax saidenbachensis]|uniref:Ribosomal silencing factor RsfS n=1 Tax=Rhodoferax saidenbachensis TaxID=1484693 RepID=A0ABU1ZL58_9BURK|nr:ribosome silencing factor [Rhodoferax saidenbachensis]MDR7305281.1 ribosome-associated protein [Rhodoferax saidenbachensis]